MNAIQNYHVSQIRAQLICKLNSFANLSQQILSYMLYFALPIYLSARGYEPYGGTLVSQMNWSLLYG